VCVGAKRRLARSREELPETRVSGKVGAQHDRIGEEADESFQLRPARLAIGEPTRSRPDGEPREQDVERGENVMNGVTPSWRASVAIRSESDEAAPPNDMIPHTSGSRGGVDRSEAWPRRAGIRTNEHASTEGAPRDAPRRGPDAATT